MSTREQRRAWQDFREAHGAKTSDFRLRWYAMFGRKPTPTEVAQYQDKRKELRAPLGRKVKPMEKTVAGYCHTCREWKSRPVGAHCARCDTLLTQHDGDNPMDKLTTVTRRYEWDMAHRLPQHTGKCRRLHGHRYAAEIDVTGPLKTEGSSTGMVMDFGNLDDIIKHKLDYWDHRCMLHDADPLIHEVAQSNMVALSDLGVILVPFVPTAENLCHEIKRRLEQGTDLTVSRVRVYETPKGWAEVRS